MLFKGNWAALILPWNHDGSVDKGALKEEIAILIESKVDGIYSCGSAGEFHLLTEDEFYTVNNILSELCSAHSYPFQIGVSHANPYTCLDRIERIVSLQPSGIQIIAPDWWYASTEVSIRFFKKIVDKTYSSLPLVFYNPPHAKKEYSFEEIMSIKQEVDMVKGIKVAGGDVAWYEDMRIRKKDTDLSVFIPGHTLATGVKNGAHGSYSNVCSINPVMAQYWAFLVMNEEWEHAFDIEKRIRIFMEKAIIPYIQKGAPNYIMDRMMAVAGAWGPITRESKWPYTGLDRDEISYIRKVGNDIIPEFFIR